MTIEELYDQKLKKDKHFDIAEHLPALREYASRCTLVVEFGTRTGNSTTAFLAGGARVISYDISQHQFPCPQEVADRWAFVIADTSKLESIPECDMLFIDSLHTEEQLRGELRMHVHARKYIVMHDTIEWGSRGECGCNGINWALFPFLAEQSNRWRVAKHWNNCRGLTVLEPVT